MKSIEQDHKEALSGVLQRVLPRQQMFRTLDAALDYGKWANGQGQHD